MRPRLLIIVVSFTMLLAGCTDDGDRNDTDDVAGTTTKTVDVESCPGHWHTQIAFYIENVSITPGDPSFYQGNAVHLHADTGNLLHFHPSPTRCLPFAETLAWLDMDLNATQWTLGDKYGDMAGAYVEDRDNLTGMLLAFEPWGGSWSAVDIEPTLQVQPPDGSRLLLTYGNITIGDIQWQQDNVPPIPPNYAPQAP